VESTVDPYLFPARGRKRCVAAEPRVSAIDGLIPTFSPQGDGNTSNVGKLSTVTNWLIPTFSPQGDGNPIRDMGPSVIKRRLIPTFSPQGDGNPHYSRILPSRPEWSVDPYLFPARGRKLVRAVVQGCVGNPTG